MTSPATRAVSRLRDALALALLILAATAGEVVAVPAGSTVLVDRPTGFGALPFDGAGLSDSGTHALSADGRYVVFSSQSDALLAGDDDDTGTNVYRLDNSTGQVEQVNTAADGAKPGSEAAAGLASISADGRYVAFSAFASALVPDAPAFGLYVKDMVTGSIELASRATGASGRAAGGFALGVISGDGRSVAFTADGPLDADNVDGVADQTDMYVRNLSAGTTRMVSVTFNGAAGGVESRRQTVDIDFAGTAVAFVTESQLLAGDSDDDYDAYLRTGIGSAGEATRLVSWGNGQTPGADRATQVALSGDAKSHVAWSSGSAVYMTVVSNGAVDKAARADVARPGGLTGEDANAPAFEPVAAPGTPARLYFRTMGKLDPADTNDGNDIYTAEPTFIGDAANVRLVTSGKARGQSGPGVGAREGATVVYSSESHDLPGAFRDGPQVYLRTGGGERNISQPAGVDPRTNEAGAGQIETQHAVSDDGRVVAFQTEAPALGSDDPGNTNSQIAIRNIASGETTLVSATTDGTPGAGFSSNASIDAAGEKVAFLSSSAGLTADKPTLETHAYVRDLRSGVTTLVDRTAAGAPLVRGANEVRISADGLHVVYLSRSPDAPEAPAGGKDHLYAVDLETGDTRLVDRAASGTPANDHAQDAFDLSGDGSRVAFASNASNLGVAGSEQHPQIYVRDIAAGTTEWASPPEDGNPSHVRAFGPSLSRSGTRVAFQQHNPGFGHGMKADSQIFVRDLEARTTTLASDIAGAGARGASLSANGERVAFNAIDQSGEGAVAEIAGAPVSASGVYLRDLAKRTTTLVSIRTDGEGARGADFDVRGSLDGTGACVAFESRSASDLTVPAYGPDYTHVYLRAVDDDCPGTAQGPGDGGTPPGGAPPGGTPLVPSSGGGGGVVTPDRIPPAITRLRVTRPRFAVGGSATARSAAARGTTFTFSLSERAATTITISRRTAGRRSGKRCVKPRKGLKRSCTRLVKEITLTRKGTRAGSNRVAFTGRVGRRSLKPGSYQASLVARDGRGNRSKPAIVRFTVVRR